MTRRETDREDLFAELSSASPRWEFQFPDQSQPVVAGVRRDGRFSIYLHTEECYHFDDQGRLWRAYLEGRLYRSQGETLAELTRQRSETETVLHRRDLSPDDLSGLLSRMAAHLAVVQEQLAAGNYQLVRYAPADLTDATICAEHLARVLESGPRLAPAWTAR